MSSTADLLHRLRNYVQEEANTQFNALQQQWSRPLCTRVANGWAIEGVRLAGDDKKRMLRLYCDSNHSRFREGDLLVLHHHTHPLDPNALHVELQYDGETELEVSIIRGNINFLLAEPDGWVLDQGWFDSRPFYLEALDTVADSLRGRSIILPLLQGSLTPQIDYARYERAAGEVAGTGLNDSQVEAIAQAYAADLLHLIQGPPGTGKTYMLAHLAKLLVADGQRVLVTALTHTAIHNALNKIAQVDDTIPVCKIGTEQYQADLDVESYPDFDSSKFGAIHAGYVIGATPFTLQTTRLENVEFDVVLFDEASQVTLPLAIMGMLGANKYVFIGDQNQLPPVTTSDVKQAEQLSIFDFLSGRGNQTMLNITYRLNDTLVEWPSRTFYHNELMCSEAAAARRLQLSGDASRWDFVLDPSAPAVFLDLCHRNTTVRSAREAEIVVELVLALLAHHVPPDQIGVVVPYRAQSRLTRSLLRRAIRNEGIWNQIVVDTVERMQGQEREVVLVSFATASPTFAAQMASFLFQPQRLNVAVTRPRTKLILVGSHHMLKAQPEKDEEMENLALLRDLIDHCFHITLPDGKLN